MWFPTAYGVQLVSEWPEMRGHRPSRTMSDPTAVRLKASHTLTVPEIALVFLEDAQRHGDLFRPLDWIPEVHHLIGSGEAVLPEPLLYYPARPADGERGSMLRAFVEADRATMGPERLAAKLTAYPSTSIATCPQSRDVGRPSRNRCWRSGGGAIRSSLASCSSWTAPDPPVSRTVSGPCAREPDRRRRPASCTTSLSSRQRWPCSSTAPAHPYGAPSTTPTRTRTRTSESTGQISGIGTMTCGRRRRQHGAVLRFDPQTLRSEVVGHRASEYLPLVALVSRTSERQQSAE